MVFFGWQRQIPILNGYRFLLRIKTKYGTVKLPGNILQGPLSIVTFKGTQFDSSCLDRSHESKASTTISPEKVPFINTTRQ